MKTFGIERRIVKTEILLDIDTFQTRVTVIDKKYTASSYFSKDVNDGENYSIERIVFDESNSLKVVFRRTLDKVIGMNVLDNDINGAQDEDCICYLPPSSTDAANIGQLLVFCTCRVINT